MLNRTLRISASGLLLLVLSACIMGPDYQRPETPVPLAYKMGAPWKEASPQAEQARGAWWSLYNDATLNGLEEQAAAENQSLQVAMARVQQVKSRFRLSEADRLPSVNLGAGASRQRKSAALSSGGKSKTDNLFTLPFDLGYELDLWGRTRRNLEAAIAESESAQADYQSILLSLQAELARSYFKLRTLDNEISLLTQTLDLLQEALVLVESQYRNGQVSQLSLSQAETELARINAEMVGLQKQRAELVNAIALLVGASAPDFTLAAAPRNMQPPAIAPGLPSSLLERRPDVAAAERQMIAANARIGVAETAFFPAISLTGHAGYASTEIDALFNWDNRTWSLGPAVYLPIFDGGRNNANLERARAAYEESIARYRQQLLVAFQEVQDGLQGLEILDRQSAFLEKAVTSASNAWELSGKRYKAGYVSYLEVIDTQRTALQVARSLIRVQGEQMTTSVLLVKALGGGWQGF